MSTLERQNDLLVKELSALRNVVPVGGIPPKFSKDAPGACLCPSCCELLDDCNCDSIARNDHDRTQR